MHIYVSIDCLFEICFKLNYVHNICLSVNLIHGFPQFNNAYVLFVIQIV